MRNNDTGRRIAGMLINLLFPLHCPICDEIVPVGEGRICRKCVPKIRYISEPRCLKCGRQLFDNSDVLCAECERKKHVFDKGYALYDYQSMRKSIYRYKYKNRCEYSRFYAEDIYRHIKNEDWLMEAEAIIPIPLHKSRLKSRGYNQAELVAEHLSKLMGIPIYKNLIKRVRKTLPQKQLDAHARQNNLKKAFNIKPDVVKLNKTILVDDIYTTGSTIDAAAVELKRRGVEKVYFITLCIGEGS